MKILLATDGSEHSLSAARSIKELLALNPDSHVLVVHVLPLVRFPGNDDKLAQAGQKALDEAVAAIDLPAEQVTPRLELGAPGETLVRIAEETGADVIVMGARGLSLEAATLLGSTSYRVLQTAPCPVLLSR